RRVAVEDVADAQHDAEATPAFPRSLHVPDLVAADTTRAAVVRVTEDKLLADRRAPRAGLPVHGDVMAPTRHGTVLTLEAADVVDVLTVDRVLVLVLVDVRAFAADRRLAPALRREAERTRQVDTGDGVLAQVFLDLHHVVDAARHVRRRREARLVRRATAARDARTAHEAAASGERVLRAEHVEQARIGHGA